MNAGIRIPWEKKEKPNVNQWYRTRDDQDYWKIVKDFYSPELKTTFYKIVAYYNGDNVYTGKTLGAIRILMKENTWRKAV